MFEVAVIAFVSLLNEAGISAVRSFPNELIDREAPVVCVGLASAKRTGAGMGDYLGMREEEDGRLTELFGSRCELGFEIDIYSPRGEAFSAAGCTECFSDICEVIEAAPLGMKLRSVSCSPAEYDTTADMFRCRAEITCDVFLVREAYEDGGEFSDYVLRGVLRDGKQ